MSRALVLALAVAGLGCAQPAAERADGAGPATLAERTARLIAEVERQPTTGETLRERAAVLWDWANAYARRGGVVPVELPRLVAQAHQLPAGSPVARLIGPFIDGFVRELRLRTEEPGAIGGLEASSLGPFEARSFQTIQQTYTVGTRPLQPGGGLLVARQFMANHGPFQTDDPAGDNYVSIRASHAGAHFRVASYRLGGMHGGFRRAGPALVFRLEGAELGPGETVTLTYGDTSGGGRGLLLPSFSNARFPLPVYVDLDGSHQFYTLEIQPIVVTGTGVAGVHGFAPSIVGVDESFALAVRAEDRFFNRATGPIPGWTVLLDGEPLREIPPGGAALVPLEDLRIAEPGVHRFAIRSADGSIAGDANPVLVRADPSSRIYWGDTHGHSGFAEGIGTPDGFMRFARDDARLDFVTHSEHDIWMDDYEWSVLQENVRTYTEEGRFVAFLGYEWTVPNRRGGHHNVLFRTPEGRRRVPAQRYPTLSKLYQGLRALHDPADVLVIPHAHQAGDYRLSDPELENLVEIMSMHGTFEWFGRMYLAQGHQVGFIAASDDHLSHPGYSAPRGGSLAQRGGLAAVWAPARGVDAIFDAMKGLSAYATTGDRIILELELNGVPMGGRAPYAETRRLRGRVIGTAPIDTVTVVKNDAEVWQRDYLTEPAASPEVGPLTVYLQLSSESRPYHPRDNPRGWRVWRGELRVRGATLVGVEPTDFHNSTVQRLEVDPLDPSRVRFATQTRGDVSSLRLSLDDVGPEAALELGLVAARERGSGPPVFRPHAQVPAAELVLPLRELKGGRLTRELELDGYRDRVTLRRALDGGEWDVELDWVDPAEPRQGDYYYVRVKQANDAFAWSSPVWVGGYPAR